MLTNEFFEAVEGLKLNPQDYIVIGGGLLCALGLREANDIDLCVSPELFSGLERAGWQRRTTRGRPDGYFLADGIYEAGLDWFDETGIVELGALKADELVVNGVPFISLRRLKNWKQWYGGEKHLRDLALVAKYEAERGL